MTFQQKILKFEELTNSMSIPTSKRDISIENVRWLIKNLKEKNFNHKNYKEAMFMLEDWNKQLLAGKKVLK